MEGGGTSSEMDPSPCLSLIPACSCGVSSMAMVFINKAVLMQYAYSMTLLTLQQLSTPLLIHFSRVMGYTKFKDMNMATAKKLLPVSVFYNANVAFALATLKGVNIPMYIATCCVGGWIFFMEKGGHRYRYLFQLCLLLLVASLRELVTFLLTSLDTPWPFRLRIRYWWRNQVQRMGFHQSS